MHARIARYSFSGDGAEIARKAEEGILPVFRSQPGFKAYSVSEFGDELVSLSAWESADAAEAANALVTDWVAENLADKVQLIDARIGEIHFSTSLGIGTKTGATPCGGVAGGSGPRAAAGPSPSPTTSVVWTVFD